MMITEHDMYNPIIINLEYFKSFPRLGLVIQISCYKWTERDGANRFFVNIYSIMQLHASHGVFIIT